MKNYIKKIEDIKNEFGRSMQPPASTDEIQELLVKAKSIFGIVVPRDYIELLKMHNGIDFSGLQIYGTKTMPIAGHTDRYIEGLIEANAIWRDNEDNKNYAFFADDDLSLYGINLSTGRYEEIDRTSGDVLDISVNITSLLIKSIKVRLD